MFRWPLREMSCRFGYWIGLGKLMWQMERPTGNA
jgi:hypothetical protein